MIVTADDGRRRASPAATTLPDATLLERLARRASTRAHRGRARARARRSTSTAGGRWAVEVAVWDLVGRRSGSPLWQLLGGRTERLLAYASSGELVDAGGARAPRVGAARPRRARDQDPLPPRRLARATWRSSRRCATPSARTSS